MILEIVVIVVIVMLAWEWESWGAIPRIRRRGRRIAASVTEMQAAFDVGQAELELKRRPLTDIKAEAERKAIAACNPLAVPQRHELDVHMPGIQHPFDPCYDQTCPEPRSQHEHVEIIGRNTAYVVASGPIEITAIGDRERTFLVPPGFLDDPTARLANALRDQRQAVWAELERLSIVAHTPAQCTPAQWRQWDQLAEQLKDIDSKLGALCLRNITNGPGRRSRP